MNTRNAADGNGVEEKELMKVDSALAVHLGDLEPEPIVPVATKPAMQGLQRQ